MKLGSDVELEQPMTATRRRNLKRAQRVLTRRHAEFRHIKMRAPRGQEMPSVTSRKVAQFFTGGLDSFYTLLRNPEVDALVYLFDEVNEPPALTQLLRTHLQGIADHFGKELIGVDHNVRSMLDTYGEWGQQTHIALFSGVASLLSGEFSDVIIPSENAGTETSFWADHPDINPFWQSGSVNLIFDAGDVSRFDKAVVVSENSFAVDSLRVCWMSLDNLNCGMCEKCLRTQVALEILGASGRPQGFLCPLNLERVAQTQLDHVLLVELWQQNARAAVQAGRLDIEWAVTQAITASSARS
jgi:hypothetical protein